MNRKDADAWKHRKAYHHARNALLRLGGDAEYLNTLQMIQDVDMRMSGDITEENRIGQRSDTLPWFWRVGDGPTEVRDYDSNPRLKECEC